MYDERLTQLWTAAHHAVALPVKPLESNAGEVSEAQSIDDGNAVEVVTKGRHDPCVGIRATPIAEAMVALVLMDHLLRHRGQMGR